MIRVRDEERVCEDWVDDWRTLTPPEKQPLPLVRLLPFRNLRSRLNGESSFRTPTPAVRAIPCTSVRKCPSPSLYVSCGWSRKTTPRTANNVHARLSYRLAWRGRGAFWSLLDRSGRTASRETNRRATDARKFVCSLFFGKIDRVSDRLISSALRPPHVATRTPIYRSWRRFIMASTENLRQTSVPPNRSLKQQYTLLLPLNFSTIVRSDVARGVLRV